MQEKSYKIVVAFYVLVRNAFLLRLFRNNASNQIFYTHQYCTVIIIYCDYRTVVAFCQKRLSG